MTTPPRPRTDLESGLFSLPVRRPVGVTMVVLAVTVFGWTSLQRLPVSLLPDLSYPTLTIRTEYPGAAPEDVEERISERIQESVAVLSGLENYTSVSRAGMSDVILEFAWGTELSLVTGEVRERIDRALLPDDAEEPLILRYDPSLDPILRIGVTSDERSLRELRTLLEEEAERELETLPGVAAVKVRGGHEKQITVELHPDLLREHEVDVLTVSQRLAAENVNLAAGRLVEGETEYVVRTLGEFDTPEEIGELIIKDRDRAPVRLSHLGSVRVAARERDVITRVDGRESVEIEIFQEAGANLVDVATRVKTRLLGTPEQQAYLARVRAGEIGDPLGDLRQAQEEFENEKDELEGSAASLRKFQLADLERKARQHRELTDFMQVRLPPDLGFRVLSDPSTFVESSLREVRTSAITGGIFAVIVLFLFLRRLGPTFVVAVSIPLSVVATFAPFDFAGISLNVMSLGGLALGIGMLVDNSIVVLESITRCREEGDDPRQAAVRGVREVGSAVIASTLTTVAVFFPIVFVQGLAGRVFRDQAMAVVFSLLASLGVALFFIPTLAALGGRRLLSGGGGGAILPPRLLSVDRLRARMAGPGPAPRPKVLQILILIALLPLFLLHLLLEVGGIVLRAVCFGLMWALVRVAGLLVLAGRGTLLPAAWLLNRGLEGFRKLYAPLLGAAVGRPSAALLTCLVAAGLFVLAVFRVDDLGTRLLPEVHQAELSARIQSPVDTSVESSDRLAREISREARSWDSVTWASTASGVARDDIAESDEGPHSSVITVHLDARGADLPALERRIEQRLIAEGARHPEVNSLQVERPSLFRLRAPLQIELHGTDLAELKARTERLADQMRELDSLQDVKTNFSRGNREVIVHFDRDALHRVGISLQDAAQRLRNSIQGEVATRFADQDRKIDVLVRLDRMHYDSLHALQETPINAPGQQEIPLRAVAELLEKEGPSEIRQIRGDRVGVVTARPRSFDIGGEADRVRSLLERLELPRDMHWEFGGQSRESDEALASLAKALGLAVFLVYLVMAAQFESFVQPLIILFSIPLATVGVIFSLDALGWQLSVVVLLGAILLAGIVVNNAILLIDAINRRRRAGMERSSAIVEACQTRLRPILMTTATTVLGLLPLTGLLQLLPGAASLPFGLGGGEGAELRAPMAVTVISGLVTSTVLTLLVIPAVYSLVDRASGAVRRFFGPTEAELESATDRG